jgi:hypothetical protein
LIRIKADEVPEKYHDKALIVNVTNGGAKARGGRMKRGWISTRVKEFGDFTVMIDTVPPAIKPINIFNGKNITNQAEIRMVISDNLFRC